MGFDESAKSWDTDKRINRARIIANEIMNSLDTSKSLTAMEFGCGTGLISFNLKDKFEKITLIDTSKGMIDVVNGKIEEQRIKNMETLHLDITADSLPNMKFDIIYNSMVLHHIHDISAIAKCFYELLNKDGYICIVDLDEDDGSFHKEEQGFDGHNGFNQERLKSVFKDTGFSEVESKTFYYDEKIIDGQIVNYSLFLMKAKKNIDSKPNIE